MSTDPQTRSQTVALVVGESYRLELKGRGAAGYDWEVIVEGDAASIEVSRATGPAPPRPPAGEPPPSSYSVADIFVVHARRPGKAIVRLEQRRRWDKTAPARESLILTVVVTAT